MGEGLEQIRQSDHDEEDDEELFDSDSLLSNSDDDDDDDGDRDGPLYELSTLVEQLPIKRGLSKYYQGKSQSYASLSVVRTLEDLPKKERPYKRKSTMKTCKIRVMIFAALAAQEEGEGGGKKKPPLVPHHLQKNSCNSH